MSKVYAYIQLNKRVERRPLLRVFAKNKRYLFRDYSLYSTDADVNHVECWPLLPVQRTSVAVQSVLMSI